MSPAEQTMSRYQPAAAASSTGACPVDPLTHFQSTFPTGFLGCMFCGSTDHVFCSCPQHLDHFIPDIIVTKLNIVTQNPNGDPNYVEAMVMKSSAQPKIGATFTKT
jgi:hypothetical protein